MLTHSFIMNSKVFIVLWIVLLIVYFVHSLKNDELVCRDEKNNIVDWFYMYKLPKNKFSKNELIKNGVAYMYITPNTIKNGWTLSTKSINDSHSIPGLTVGPLYEDTDDYLAVVYNDQPFNIKDTDDDETPTTKKPSKSKQKPERRKTVRRDVTEVEAVRKEVTENERSKSAEKKKQKIKLKNSGNGHTKGVVIGDEKHAVWLIHSVPRFPPIPDRTIVDKVQYSYPANAMRYGQSFLCLSMRSSELNDIGQQLIYNEPKILFSKVPAKWKSRFTKIVDVVNNKTVNAAPWSHTANLTTLNNVQFTSFAKSTNFKNDLYSGLVAPKLKSALLVESWINGAGVLDSNCTARYKVNNIEKIAFHDKGIAFSSHADHSKWAISVSHSGNKGKDSSWICVGDINRAETQESRGGGTVCTRNADLWTMYHQLINEIEPCNKPRNVTNFVTNI